MAILELEIASEVPAGLDLAPLQRVVAGLNAATGLDLPAGTINLAFTDDAGSRELNVRYSGNDYATDVLSFSYIEDGGEPIAGVIGEMSLSYETAVRQAQAAGTDVATEVALLALHGMLHIAGYDHQTLEQQAALQQLQAELMAGAGLTYREFTWQD